MNRMTRRGISTTRRAGEEQYDWCETGWVGRERVKRVQYDYRHTDKTLFSCVAVTLEDARARRDAWLEGKPKAGMYA